RIDGVHPDKVQPFYTVLEQLYTQHRYHPCNVFDMDKTGYAMGDMLGEGVLPMWVLRIQGLPEGKGCKSPRLEASGSLLLNVSLLAASP
ncbi:UNVERIFIED_CONTAM: hypothetical protein NY603_27585, partial [Bacteroidetes bacterium 56_B9]